jgi:hypothetical protein
MCVKAAHLTPPRPGHNLGLGRESGPSSLPAWAVRSPADRRCISAVGWRWTTVRVSRPVKTAPSRIPNRTDHFISSLLPPRHSRAAATIVTTSCRRRRLRRHRRAPRRRASSPEAELAAVERSCERCPLSACHDGGGGSIHTPENGDTVIIPHASDPPRERCPRNSVW